MKVECLENMMKRKKEYLSEIIKKKESDYLSYSDGNIIGYFQGQIDLLEVLIDYEGMEESSE